MTSTSTKRKTNKKTAKKLIKDVNFYFSVAILALLVYLLFFASLSPFSFSCYPCHADQSKTHESSTHKDFRCSACHAGVSLFSKLNFRFLLAAMPGYLFTDGSKKTAVKNDACVYCHRTVVNRTTQGRSGVRMSHREPLQEGYLCSDCHIKDAHPSSKLKKGFFEMLECLRCHNGVKAKKECAYCHVEKNYRVQQNNYPTIYKQIHNDLKSHGKNPLSSCSSCHDMSYCATCHVMITKYRVALPHPQDWIGIHPYSTDRNNVRACYACHGKKFCLDCHGVEMPHPENYVRFHIAEARQAEAEKCYKCHTKESCDFCHINHRHPGIPQDILKALRRLAGFE
jgi:ferredoxin